MPPPRDPITGKELAAYFLEESGAKQLVFIFCHKAITVANDLTAKENSSTKKDDDNTDPSSGKRGFAHLDLAYTLFRNGRVESRREAARIVAQGLWDIKEEFPGRYPGASFDAATTRIYNGLREKLKDNDGKSSPSS